jgi:ssDNA-binding Zn-finger/Zn-ribbon topoisomerase 1
MKLLKKIFFKILNISRIRYNKELTILECENCGHTFPSKEVELTNADITDEYFNIHWNCPKCNTEGLTMFINNRSINTNSTTNKSNNNKR